MAKKEETQQYKQIYKISKCRLTPIDGLLDAPAVPVVAAVPQLVPELVLALHQALTNQRSVW